MTHRRIDRRIAVPGSGGLHLAVTLHLPNTASQMRSAPILLCMPGAGYNRRYFDLPEAGYSQAEHHVARGIVVIAIDHLGVGESSVPPPDACTIRDVARANAAVAGALLAELAEGTLVEGVALRADAVIGIGQSMGGFVTVAMQAYHRAFDAIAVLGASMVCTRLPSPRPGGTLRFPADADRTSAAQTLLMETDWRFGFHWEDVPESLVAADIASKPPTFGPVAPWGSATVPNIAELVLPGVLAREAGGIDVPVLLGMGERDVCQDPLRELAAFYSAPDLALTVVPTMAHMHNFAGSRAMLWRRIDAFVAQVAAEQTAANTPGRA